MSPVWRPAGAAKAALAYLCVAVLAVASFVLLHHVGNQTPFGVAAERFSAEFEAEPVAWGTRRPHLHTRWEYCYLSSAVLAGARVSATPFDDALAPRTLAPPAGADLMGGGGGYCRALQRAVDRAERAGRKAPPNLAVELLPHRQWFGSKALYAIGMRFWPVHEYHELIRKATYAAYVTLAVALLTLGWRTLVAAGPVLVFGWALSGIEQLSDVAKGTPHIWGLVTAALFALLLRCAFLAAAAARLFCFFAGMVASYLWLFDGAHFVAVTLIGLAAWFHYDPLAVKTRVLRSAACMFAHTVGFVVGVVLSTVVKGAAAASSQFTWGFQSVLMHVGRIIRPEDRDHQGGDIGTWMEMLPLGAAEVDVLISSSVVALGTAVLVAGYRRWRRDNGPILDVLWIGMLGLVALFHFALPNDLPFQAARLTYLPLALCWSALAAVLLRTPRPVAHLLAILAAGGVLVAGRLLWQHVATTALMQGIAAARSPTAAGPVIRDHFDVHLQNHRLIYHRDQCEDVDVKRRFVLDVYPEDTTELPVERRSSGFASQGFYFVHHRRFTFDDRCVAVVELPAYPVAKITTGTYCCYRGETSWRASARIDSPGPAAP